MMCPDCGGEVRVTAGVLAHHMTFFRSGLAEVCPGTGARVSTPDSLQDAADLAPMLRYAASLAVEGKPATPYVAMLASIRGELNRLFSTGLGPVVHDNLPAPTQEESP